MQEYEKAMVSEYEIRTPKEGKILRESLKNLTPLVNMSLRKEVNVPKVSNLY